MFKIFHTAMQSISNIAEIESRNIHNHVFLLQSSRKSVRGLPLVGRKTFWPEDFLGGRLRWDSVGTDPGFLESVTPRPEANWKWDKFFVRIVPVEKPIKFISPKMSSKQPKERMFHLARYIFTNTIVHMQKGSHGVN